MSAFDYGEFPYHVITLGADGHKTDEHLVLSRHIIAANAGFNIMAEARPNRTVLMVQRGRIIRDSREPSGRRKDDKTRYGYPPQLEAFHPAEPLDYPLMELAGMHLVTHCRCGMRPYPLRLMAAQVGWGVTLRQLLPKLVCKICGERPARSRLVADPVHGAAGRQGGDPWFVDLS